MGYEAGLQFLVVINLVSATAACYWMYRFLKLWVASNHCKNNGNNRDEKG